MLVKEVMAKPVIKIDCEKTVLEACSMYKDYKIGTLLVTKKDECVGIITERNIIERTICAGKTPEKTKVKEIMSTDIKTIHALDTLEKTIEIMIKYNIKKLPVTLNDEIVGIITVTDIARARPDLSKRFIDSWVKARWRD